MADQFIVALTGPAYTSGGTITHQSVIGTTSDGVTPTIDLSTDNEGDQVAVLTVNSTPSSLNPTGQLHVATEKIQVDPLLRYEFSSLAPDDPRTTGLQISYAAFDDIGRRIEPTHVNRFQGATDTFLIQAMTPCRDEIVVADASGWSNALRAPASSRALAIFNGANASGQSQFAYTRNTMGNESVGAWDAGEITFNAALGGYRIPLTSQWMGDLLPAGAAVRNAVYDTGTFELPSQITGRASLSEQGTI